MPFPSALSGGQVTQVQKATQDFEHYLLVNPNDIVWQAEVNETLSAATYAEFDWTNTLQGVRTDVRVGHVVLVTTGTTDFNDPVLRGRIRSTSPDATTVYLNESAVDIDPSMYVTVLDDFELLERLQHVDVDGNIFKDWDLIWEDLPPSIDNLQSVYADLSGSATSDFAFAPTATTHADGASISTWAWDIEDGSFQAGGAGTQNITARFTLATATHRWVHLTVTDDNGNSTTYHFEVYTVDVTSSSEVVLPIASINITASIQEGFNATITPFDSFARTSILDQTRCAVASIDNYDGTATPIVSNIMMIGRLRTEDSATRGDEQHSTSQDATLNLEGFGTILGRLPAPSLYIVDNPEPGRWGQILDPDPTRAIVYFLAFHTTVLTLISIDFEDLSAYIFGDLSIEEVTALDNINKQADSVNAIAQFAASGEIAIQRRASYLSTADRAGLTTVYDFVTGDIVSIDNIGEEYGKRIGEIRAGAIVYNTTDDDIKFRFVGRAPSTSFGQGHETTQLNGQILTADETDTNARAELVVRAANHLEAVNPKVQMRATLMDGFWWLVPTLYQRYTFTLAATDTIRGQVFADTDFWQLVDISYSATQNDRTVSRIVSATFEVETQGENAGISVTLIPDPASYIVPAIPPMSGYLDFFADPLTYYPTDTSPDRSLGGTTVTEPYPPDVIPEPTTGSQTLKVNMRTGATVSTAFNTVGGERYVITVTKQGFVEQSAWTKVFDFSIDERQWVQTTPKANIASSECIAGGYVAGSYWEVTGNDASVCGIAVKYELPYVLELTSMVTQMRVQCGATSFGPRASYGRGFVAGTESIFTQVLRTCPGGSGTFGVTVNDFTADVLETGGSILATGGGAFVRIQRVTLNGVGENPFDNTKYSLGDAFYKGYNTGSPVAYGGTDGLTIDGAKPGTLPSYSANHVYTFVETGTGAPFDFAFGDSDFTDNSATNLLVKVTGTNMGYPT